MVPEKTGGRTGSLAVRMGILEREHRIARHPEIYYVTPHYRGSDTVLARIDLMRDPALQELLESAHEFMTVKKRAAAKRRPRSKS